MVQGIGTAIAHNSWDLDVKNYTNVFEALYSTLSPAIEVSTQLF